MGFFKKLAGFSDPPYQEGYDAGRRNNSWDKDRWLESKSNKAERNQGYRDGQRDRARADYRRKNRR